MTDVEATDEIPSPTAARAAVARDWAALYDEVATLRVENKALKATIARLERLYGDRSLKSRGQGR